MQSAILNLSSILTLLFLPLQILNVGSALPSDQDVPNGQERVGECDSIGNSLMPYISPTTHGGAIPPSPGNAVDGNMTSNLRIVDYTMSMFVPSADATHSQPRMYKQMYATAVNLSTSVVPSVRITFTYGAFTLTLTTLARVVPLDVVIAVLQFQDA
ncbi:hypothetical protein HO133_001290 [Letharia lupina]|uniref:Uncharacterized protein n=1 Tax=Letharia lupina TaxID=560253 RepID=A0A8H6CFF7_9LECA|nr:uncharacterized protein HO133_001290 [Letharia lupina]KAF6222204.1 hypothetical protein HO133_001290 [Letharia lupina]